MTSDLPPAQFAAALRSLRGVRPPASVGFREVPAPNHLAPYAAAIAFEIPEGVDNPSCTATLVVLYDPDQEETWGAPFRMVGQARTAVDRDMGADPLLGEVLWALLDEQLHEYVGQPNLFMGTVTREISETFGGLTLRASALNAEVRCSWTPSLSPENPDISGSFLAWTHFLEKIAAVPEANEYGLEVHHG